MLRSVVCAGFAVICMFAVTAKAEDLYTEYPNAKDQFMNYTVCRAGYIKQHFNEDISDVFLVGRSTQECVAEGRKLSAKIVQAKGNPAIFMAKLDFILRTKVAQLRRNSIPSTPAVEWEQCIARKLKVPVSPASPDMALGVAYTDCQGEEQNLRAYLKQNAGDETASRAIALFKAENKKRVLLLMATKR